MARDHRTGFIAVSTPDVTLDQVTKRFGDVLAVDGVALAVERGEFFSFLGPSGSGKTTCLRMIAGFEHPTQGRILLGGTDVSRQPPYERDVNTVFQDYALFPHLSVGDNVAYGLRIRKVSKALRRERAAEALTMVRLSGVADRRITQLSGGQRQRVALARALVNDPRVLLLDEPLGALDLKLRQEMQVELKRIQHEVGITFIYVTHDQDEALAMSDRIAIFNHGRIEQIGSPADVYEHPVSAFVAGFVGTSNVIDGDLARRLRGTTDAFTVRPEKITMIDADAVAPADVGEVRCTGTVADAVYLGERTRYSVTVDGGGSITVVDQNRLTSSVHAGDRRGVTVRLAWDRSFDQVLAVAGSDTAKGRS